MRKVALLAIASLIISVPPPSDAGVRVEQSAYAFWQFGSRGAHRFPAYGAIVWTGAAAGGKVPHFAGVGRFVCERERHHHVSYIDCRARNAAIADPDKTFSMTPDGSAATLKIRKRGMTHVVTWRANVTDAGTYQEERPCRYAGHALGAGFSRDARARGRIFRRSLAPTHDAILEVGAMASQCLSPHLHFDDAGRLERIEIAAGWR